jgi:hypothetical protein
MLPIATSTAITKLEAAGRWSDALAAALAGNPELAAAVLVAAPAGQRDWLTQVRDGWRGDDVALAALEASLRAAPANATGLKWAWLLEARRCANPAATAWARVLAILDGEDVGVPVELGARPQPTSMRPMYYPLVLYPVMAPAEPYVTGTWTYALGPPECSDK